MAAHDAPMALQELSPHRSGDITAAAGEVDAPPPAQATPMASAPVPAVAVPVRTIVRHAAGTVARSPARSLGPAATRRPARPVGTAGVRPTGTPGAPDEYRDVVRTAQGEVMPYDKNYFRTGDGLTASLAVLDDAWGRACSSLRGEGADAYRAREAASMVATARWMYRSALARPETRGMHRRDDHPALDPAQQHRILTGGVDEVWTSVETLDWAAPEAGGRRDEALAVSP